MGGNGGSRDINEPFGPIRQLKQAPKLSFLDTKSAWEVNLAQDGYNKIGENRFEELFEFKKRDEIQKQELEAK